MLLFPKIPVRSGCAVYSDFVIDQCVQITDTSTKTVYFVDSIYIITLNCINITVLNIKLHSLDFHC